MKQGFVTAVMADYSFEQVVDYASANGFECIEVACWPRGKAERRYAGVTHIDVEDLDDGKAEYIRDYCDRKGVEISALAYYPNTLDPDPERRRIYVGHLKKVISAAVKLEVGIVATFIGRVPYLSVSENLKIAEEVWRPLIRFAEEKKVKIAIENCPMLFTEDEWPGGQNLATSPAIWRKLFDMIPSPYFGLNFDPSHFVWQEMDYIKPIYEFKDKIFHVHYKDIKVNKAARDETGIMAPPLSYMTVCIPGHGDVDWAEYISALLEIDYQGAACIEIEDRAFEKSMADVEKALEISRRYLEQYIAFPEKGEKSA